MDNIQVEIRVCNTCSNQVVLEATASEWDAYNRGAFVQDAFPNMSPGKREMLISGICNVCWDEMFAIVA